MDPVTMIWAAAAVIGAIYIVKITLEVIRKWLTRAFERTTMLFWTKNRFAHLVRRKLRNGDYEVAAAVLDRNRLVTQTQTWKGKLDSETEQVFSGRDAIEIQNW
jgi:hypothetical protein